MKMYKKVIAALMTGTMAVSLAACGGTGNTGSTSAASASSSKASASDKSSGEKANLKMIFWDSNQEPGLVAMAEGFMKQNPDINVSVETIPWDEYWTKLQAAATGGDMPDVVVMHPDQVKNYAEGNMLMDLSDVLAGDTANASHFPDYVVNDFTIDGKQYGVPKDLGIIGLFYNKDLFDKAGVAYPTNDWTWDDLMSAAEKLTNKDNDVYGFAAPNEGQNFYWNLIWQNGGDVFNKDKSVCTFDSPETIEAMKYAVSFVEKGYSPTPADFANLTQDEYFESGKCAMITTGSWMLTEYLAVEGLNFDIAEMPMQKVKATECSGMAFSVAANTKYPEAAKKLVEYLGSEEAQLIEAKSGVAIPAYENTAQPWVDSFTTINAAPLVAGAEYGHTSPGLTTSNEASAILDDIMPQVFSLEMPVEEGCKAIAEGVNALIQ
ncbi:MAG: sugar ABC transporter substrate-binding protein [Lachnospiraceae bacterium]|nr:sugar ABC transporter substrate-binding protein [Lachnospiraceae bacterium]